MKKALIFLCMFAATVTAEAAKENSKPGDFDGHSIEGFLAEKSPLEKIIDKYAEISGKKVLTDPRVKGSRSRSVPADKEITYEYLLGALATEGFAAVTVGSYVYIVPDGNARSLPMPVMEEGNKYIENELVTAVISLSRVCASELVAVLRPLIPQSGHLSAVMSSNSLVVVDQYANVMRINKVIEKLESKSSNKEPCARSTESK